MLAEILRDGARRILRQTIEGEAADYVEKHRAAIKRWLYVGGVTPSAELDANSEIEGLSVGSLALEKRPTDNSLTTRRRS